jgi:hypothetical protein
VTPFIRLLLTPRFRRRGCRTAACGLLLVLASCGVQPVDPPPVRGPLPRVIPAGGLDAYTRTAQTGPDAFAMQTGSRLFRKAGAPAVDLVGVAHIGSADYYQRVSRRLAQADLVLFEGVTDGTQGEPLDRDPAAIAKVHSKSGYGRIGSSLGLSSQGEQIRYERPRFRRCDMTIQEMIQLLDDDIARGGETGSNAAGAKAEMQSIKRVLGGESLLMNSMLGLVKINHSLRSRIRLSMVAIGTRKSEEEGVSARLKKLINEDRNEHVIRELSQVLRKEPGRRRIAVFYGSAHHADLERRLRKLGYSPAGPVSWETAIVSNPYSDGISPAEVREALNKE